MFSENQVTQETAFLSVVSGIDDSLTLFFSAFPLRGGGGVARRRTRTRLEFEFGLKFEFMFEFGFEVLGLERDVGEIGPVGGFGMVVV